MFAFSNVNGAGGSSASTVEPFAFANVNASDKQKAGKHAGYLREMLQNVFSIGYAYQSAPQFPL